MNSIKKLILFIIIFLGAFFIPFESNTLQNAISEAFFMLQEYAREHVLFCLIPAFFIAGAIANFISQKAVLKYFGGNAKKIVSYSISSVSGIILAVCSCTVLPLFSGIYKRGAGIGPATAFLYSGPAINVLAIALTARVLGWQLGLARALASIIFAVVIGLLMAFIFKKDEKERLKESFNFHSKEKEKRNLGQNGLYFFIMILILIFATWSKPDTQSGIWYFLFSIKWYVVIGLLISLFILLKNWFEKDELKAWISSTWEFAEQILPLLFAGVLVAGFLMGRPDSDAALIPAEWVARFVGGNSLLANFTASILSAFMYFATLTEVPILQGLRGLGMGEGPSLAMLLSGPALSLPNMLVIRSVLGTKKTLVFISLVVILSTFTGLIYGTLFV